MGGQGPALPLPLFWVAQASPPVALPLDLSFDYERSGHDSWVNIATEEIVAGRRRRFKCVSNGRGTGDNLSYKNRFGSRRIGVNREIMRHTGILIVELDGYIRAG